MRKVKLPIVILVLAFILGCNVQSPLEKYNCKIIDSESTELIKKSIYIQIPNKLNELQLAEIANHLRKNNGQYERLFITYLLPDMEIGSGAFATSHFNKKLDIQIHGADFQKEVEMEELSSNSGEIIGKWYDDRPYAECSIIISKKDGNYKMQKQFKDGSVIEKELEFSKLDNAKRFSYNNDFGQYMLIKEDGKLWQYDDEGVISVANIID